MGAQEGLFRGACGMFGACQVTDSGDQQDDCAEEATPNLKVAIIVMALAAVLPCVTAIVGMAAQFGIPAPVSIGLNLVGIVVVAVKGVSIAYGIGRLSTA
jgi:hypothetical protein